MPRQERAHTESEVAAKLADLPGWSFESNAIQRRFATEGWPATLMLVNAIGYLCEAADHHRKIMPSPAGWPQMLAVSSSICGRA